jgi:hypothetical protein
MNVAASRQFLSGYDHVRDLATSARGDLIYINRADNVPARAR